MESLGPSLHYFKKPIIRHQSIYVIRKSLPLQSRLSSLHTVITGTKSIFNHFTDWAHQLSRNIVSCLLCESNIWAKTITLLCSRAALKMPCCHFPMSWTLSFYLYPSPDAFFPSPQSVLSFCLFPFFFSPSLSSSLPFSFTPCPWLGHEGSHLKLYKSIRYNKLLLTERERKEGGKTTYCFFNTSCVFVFLSSPCCYCHQCVLFFFFVFFTLLPFGKQIEFGPAEISPYYHVFCTVCEKGKKHDNVDNSLNQHVKADDVFFLKWDINT